MRTGELSDLELTAEFDISETMITDQEGNEREIWWHTQISKSVMSKLTKIWHNKMASNVSKKILVQTLVYSIFLYGSESWTSLLVDRIKE